MDIKDRTLEAIKGIFATKGKNKGKILSKAPAMSTDAYAAWQGAQMVCNPYKVSIMGACLMSEDQTQIMNLTTQLFEKIPGAQFLDKDRAALETLGVW